MLFVWGLDEFCVLDWDQFRCVLTDPGSITVSREPREFFRVRGSHGVLSTPIPPSAYPRRVLEG